SRRLGVQLSQVGVDLAGFDQQLILLETLGKATATYWKWVSTGQKLTIVERLLKLAEVRQDALKRQVEQGSSPEILLRDNMRLILSRRELLVSAEQALNEAALQLSLFHRDREGAPIVPTREDLPEDFPGAGGMEIALEADLQAIPNTRPDVQFLEGLRRQFGVEKLFGENLGTPTLDVNVKASQDAGDPQFYGFASETERSRNEAELGLKVSFELPVQRRKGRGEVMRTSAAIRRMDAELMLALQTAVTELRGAFIRLQAAEQRIDLTQETYQLALQLEEAERRRFELGQSNLLFVNQREVMSANDASKVIDAQRTYQEALALYRIARGSW
ncbi:MAG: TolC family protein, partial [Myxococcota bacterium]